MFKLKTCFTVLILCFCISNADNFYAKPLITSLAPVDTQAPEITEAPPTAPEITEAPPTAPEMTEAPPTSLEPQAVTSAPVTSAPVTSAPITTSTTEPIPATLTFTLPMEVSIGTDCLNLKETVKASMMEKLSIKGDKLKISFSSKKACVDGKIAASRLRRYLEAVSLSFDCTAEGSSKEMTAAQEDLQKESFATELLAIIVQKDQKSGGSLSQSIKIMAPSGFKLKVSPTKKTVESNNWSPMVWIALLALVILPLFLCRFMSRADEQNKPSVKNNDLAMSPDEIAMAVVEGPTAV